MKKMKSKWGSIIAASAICLLIAISLMGCS